MADENQVTINPYLQSLLTVPLTDKAYGFDFPEVTPEPLPEIEPGEDGEPVEQPEQEAGPTRPFDFSVLQARFNDVLDDANSVVAVVFNDEYTDLALADETFRNSVRVEERPQHINAGIIARSLFGAVVLSTQVLSDLDQAPIDKHFYIVTL